MKRLATLFAFAIFMLLPSTVTAAECQFVLGFKTLRDLIGHDTVGECLENEHYNHIGDSVQQTTGGLLVWRKADNWTAFTDGYRSWINGPYGVEQRFNIELLPWEADGAIKRLPWVQDGIASREQRSTDPRDASRFEQSFVGDLVRWAEISRPTFAALMGMPWTQDKLTFHEYTAVTSLQSVTYWNIALARRVLAMPFLEAIDAHEVAIIQTIGELRSIDEQLPGRVVAHPALTGGITDAHTDDVFLVVIELMAPQEAAAMRAFPWVRDGVAESELGSLQVLQVVSVNSQRLLAVLAQKPWVRDGLSKDEREVIASLRSMGGRNSQRQDEESAIRIAGMPFLDHIDETDKRESRALSALHWRGSESNVQAVLSHPRLRDGIGDEESALVSLLPPTLEDALELPNAHP